MSEDRFDSYLKVKGADGKWKRIGFIEAIELELVGCPRCRKAAIQETVGVNAQDFWVCIFCQIKWRKRLDT